MVFVTCTETQELGLAEVAWVVKYRAVLDFLPGGVEAAVAGAGKVVLVAGGVVACPAGEADGVPFERFEFVE